MAVCEVCGAELNENGNCPMCDIAVEEQVGAEAESTADVSEDMSSDPVEKENTVSVSAAVKVTQPAPDKLQAGGVQMTGKERLIKPWGYVWYNILFSIPVIGWIFAIVWSFDSRYQNRKNFARSWFCTIILFLVVFALIMIALIIFMLVTAGSVAALFKIFGGAA